ncbi:efflux RND transporter periplasmic adaptor subunit [Shewanella cyperi]|uniref:efflux RND transporter periplasmic adaptor subunit n=1 Tax=Shewanella cyperi TaxID=2814292 RepID=UPI001A9432C6|nr:efflux RND transporter periplasmic adaptor subunit [Shewanella cyperi]QSX39733.1 efflux RND transporter periplasmic adaptor subunit [Shewanella cyperi]
MDRLSRSRRIHSISVLLGLALLAGCDGDPDSKQSKQLPSVTTQVLEAQNHYEQTLEFSGTVRAGNTTGVGFELGGKLSQLMADSGDKVQAGQVLARLDTQLLDAELRELEASLAQNSADLALAQATLKRSETLNEKGYASGQQLDELRGQLASLEAGRARLQAARDAIKLKLDKSSLIAPFEGTISIRHFNLGEVLPQGQPVFTLIQSGNPQAHVGVPAELARSLSVGSALDVRVGNTHYQARLEGISAALNPLTRTVGLRLALPGDVALLNGEILYLNLSQQINTPGYWVPMSALTDGLRGLWNLYVVVRNDQGEYRVERRDVEILYTDKDRAYLTGALGDKEAYIPQGLHKLVVGQQVSPISQLATR